MTHTRDSVGTCGGSFLALKVTFLRNDHLTKVPKCLGS